MMVLPFLMIMVLPKLINTADPETQRVSTLAHENFILHVIRYY